MLGWKHRLTSGTFPWIFTFCSCITSDYLGYSGRAGGICAAAEYGNCG